MAETDDERIASIPQGSGSLQGAGLSVAPSRLHAVFVEVSAALEEALMASDDSDGAAQAAMIRGWHANGNVHAAWAQAVGLLERVLGAPLH